MATAFDYLLTATISHLEDQKARGVKHVSVDPQLLSQLGRPAGKPESSAPAETRPSLSAALKESAAPTAPVAEAAPVVSDLIVDSSVELSPERKETEMARIRERAMNCIQCSNLASSRSNVVFGVGTIHTDLMFVGEAPGHEEDQQGEPFVGAAGQLLTKIIGAMDLDRDKVYIANVLKCRPDTPGQRSGNRKPKPEEMNTCKPYLLAQISVIRPKVIVALGATAVEGLLGRPMGIMKLRGNWQDFNGIPMMPTYHPAYLLRNESISEKRKVWEDMLAVMEKLGMPISEKQRGFFQGK
jgi:uracil-DNA glycosylase family 4